MAGLVEKEVYFKNWKVPELKKYLEARGISVSNKKKGRTSRIDGKSSRTRSRIDGRS